MIHILDAVNQVVLADVERNIDISILNSFQPPEKLIRELDLLMQAWDSKDAVWSRMMEEVSGDCIRWRKEEKSLVSEEMRELARRMLRRPAVLDSWMREIHADSGAYEYGCAAATMGGWLRGSDAAWPLARVNVEMGLFLWLSTFFEIYARLRGREVDVTTHPPGAIRRAVFFHIQARRTRMPLEDFMFRQFGAGTAVTYIMERINEEYVRRRGIAIKA